MKTPNPKPSRRNYLLNNQEDNNSGNAVSNRAKGLALDIDLRNFEITQLTQRNNFFMVFQGVLIAGLIQSQGLAAPLINFSVSLLGMAISLFQIGMAGGAKYWQSRWEASTRSSEIAIALELLRKDRLAVRTFTHDLSLLSDEEREEVESWNKTATREDEKIVDLSNFIDQAVLRDISKSRGWFFKKLDWWVRKLAILPKWSVSRIPIWVGAALFVFWLVITLHSFRISGLDFSFLEPSWFELVPLKNP